uniref:Uncharacterized protein n=1 Tax=Maylandia zebra TaxID=106582 RepID=A0A3P9BEE4_9CICH
HFNPHPYDNERALGEAACSSPQTVLAVTRTSILTDGQPQWIHASRVKTIPEQRPNINYSSWKNSLILTQEIM